VGLAAQIVAGTFSIVTLGVTAGLAAFCKEVINLGAMKSIGKIKRNSVGIVTKMASIEDGYELQYIRGLQSMTLKVPSRNNQ